MVIQEYKAMAKALTALCFNSGMLKLEMEPVEMHKVNDDE